MITSDEVRRDRLRRWTGQELPRLGQQQLAKIFLITSADPVTTPPWQLFFGRCWYEPASTAPVSLVLSLPPPVAPIPVPGNQVWPAR